jgi:hypothetical protein
MFDPKKEVIDEVVTDTETTPETDEVIENVITDESETTPEPEVESEPIADEVVVVSEPEVTTTKTTTPAEYNGELVVSVTEVSLNDINYLDIVTENAVTYRILPKDASKEVLAMIQA